MPNLGCNGPDPVNCAALLPNNVLNSSNDCNCDSNYSRATGAAFYDCSVYSGPCAPGCAECSGPDAEQCLRCDTNRVFGLLPDGRFAPCICIEGWTGDNCDVWEGPCEYLCDECTGPTGCTKCIPYAWCDYCDKVAACNCVPGFSDPGYLNQCRKEVHCDPSCSTCADESCDGCLTCCANAQLVTAYPQYNDQRGSCHCIDGYVPFPDASNCIPNGCHHSCLTCKGPTEHNCT